ncbi:MAG: phosphotransferase [Chloroflexota bacterium]|nr:phosphotransferase [Chloroflexota bacterium]
MTLPPAEATVFARVELPDDPDLPSLPKLFDSGWVCEMIRNGAKPQPARIRIHHFIHSIGNSATVSYEVEWPGDSYLPSDYYVARTGRDGRIELRRYPDDQRLPGLVFAARPDAALQLINDQVLSTPARRARVQLIRYRPGYRAVLRHRFGRIKLYARVVRPGEFEAFLAAYQLSAQSGYLVPGLAGCWDEGGVLWFTELRGSTLRRRIRKGKAPHPDSLLSGLEVLWQAPQRASKVHPLNLERAYQRALRSFKHNLRDFPESSRNLQKLEELLSPFVQSWRPASMAHNDFYDDQLLVLRDGRLALVDFEDIAPGDPLLDVGNFLAHLRWSARFARETHAENCRDYRDGLRHAALSRFGWDEEGLALREAVCLFRICTNAIRHPKADWRGRLDAGLLLVSECLG